MPVAYDQQRAARPRLGKELGRRRLQVVVAEVGVGDQAGSEQAGRGGGGNGDPPGQAVEGEGQADQQGRDRGGQVARREGGGEDPGLAGLAETNGRP